MDTSARRTDLCLAFHDDSCRKVDSGPGVKDRPERPVVSAMRSMRRHPPIAQSSQHVPYVSLGVAGHGLLEVTRAPAFASPTFGIIGELRVNI